MSNKTDIVLIVSTEELPYFLKTYDERKYEMTDPGFTIGAHPDGWVLRLANVTTREALEFFAYVYADMPEETVHTDAPISEAAELMRGIPMETEEVPDEELEDQNSWPEEADPEEDSEEEDSEDESLADLSDTEEGREVKAKLKKVVKVRKAVPSAPSERKLAEAATVVSTGNKSVTIEGS